MTIKTKPSIKELIGKTIHSATQEYALELPARIIVAFRMKSHLKDTDPSTGKPFASFYAWLMAPPPPGVGLSSSKYMDASDIVKQLTRNRDSAPDGKDRDLLNAVIEDLTKGIGASRGKGGRPNKDNPQSTLTVSARRQGKSDSLAARLAESADPEIRKAWNGYLDGRHKSVTAAAIACGMIEDANAPLKRLKENWNKATAAERAEFLEFIKDE